MWSLIIEAADAKTRRVPLREGKCRIGRASGSEIMIEDAAASRVHAEFEFDSPADKVYITDLNSTNGTYVNRERIQGRVLLRHNDIIRVGQVVLLLENETQKDRVTLGTHRFTRDLVLESVDHHAVLLYEISRKLNTVTNTDAALHEVAEMLRRALPVERCEVVLRKDFDSLPAMGFDSPLARQAIDTHSAEIRAGAMFVPVMGGDEVLALICMDRGRSDLTPFSQRDFHLAVAISHQTALTIQRMQLMELVRAQENIQKMLLRFVSPTEATYLVEEYTRTGKLPGLSEQKVTVLFSDLAGSTAMAEKLGAAHFGRILNDFYELGAEITFRSGGMIKYLGDGILAIFPDASVQNAEEKAVLAGRELIDRVRRPNSLGGDGPFEIGVAINTGSAMLGYVGVEERAEFNVLGDMVNIAYRMQDYARPFKIIIGPTTAAALTGKLRFNRVGAVTLKGREQAVQAYEVLP